MRERERGREGEGIIYDRFFFQRLSGRGGYLDARENAEDHMEGHKERRKSQIVHPLPEV